MTLRNAAIRQFLLVFGLAVVLAVGAMTFPSPSHAGNWEWWGYRTNSWQTWALATQSPDYVRWNIPPHYGNAVYVMARSWRWNAQSARMLRKCTGLTWSASPIIVGCSWR